MAISGINRDMELTRLRQLVGKPDKSVETIMQNLAASADKPAFINELTKSHDRVDAAMVQNVTAGTDTYTPGAGAAAPYQATYQKPAAAPVNPAPDAPQDVPPVI